MGTPKCLDFIDNVSYWAERSTLVNGWVRCICAHVHTCVYILSIPIYNYFESAPSTRNAYTIFAFCQHKPTSLSFTSV